VWSCREGYPSAEARGRAHNGGMPGGRSGCGTAWAASINGAGAVPHRRPLADGTGRRTLTRQEAAPRLWFSDVENTPRRLARSRSGILPPSKGGEATLPKIAAPCDDLITSVRGR
jgi:hypothetical protein